MSITSHCKSNTRFVLLCIVFGFISSCTEPLFASTTHFSFIENHGQVIDDAGIKRNEILFYANLPGLTMYFTKSSFYYVQIQQETSSKTIINNPFHTHTHDEVSDVFFNRFTTQVNFIGCNSLVTIQPNNITPYYQNFYLSHCGTGIEQVRTFSEIVYREIYKGIDVRFYFYNSALKFEYIVHPGANPNQIQLEYSKDANLLLSEDGDLLLRTSLGIIRDSKPFTYYQGDVEESIRSSFAIDGNILHFKIAEYNTNKKIIIDPAIQWSTYFGGVGEDEVAHICIDKNNNNIIIGRTYSLNFPIKVGFQSKSAGVSDAFISQLNSDGKLLWSTYFGGTQTEVNDKDHCDLFVDNNNDIVFTCCTNSLDILCKNPFQSSKSSNFDIVIGKLTNTGNLIWSSYCGGNDDDDSFGITTDNNNNIYVIGITASDNFPQTDNPNIIERINKRFGKAKDGFIIKIRSNGTPVWSEYYGGSDFEYVKGIVTDQNGGIYVCGYTQSTDFRVTSSAIQKSNNGGTDGFVMRFDAFGSVIWSSYFGGDNYDAFNSISIDSSSLRQPKIILCGTTQSTNLQNLHTFVSDTLSGNSDIVLLSLSNDGIANWAKLYGGLNLDEATAVCVDRDNHLIMTGFTGSDVITSHFPLLGGFQSTFGGYGDCYVMKLTEFGKLEFCSYLGGSGAEQALDIATDSATNFITVGYTISKNNFPIVNAEYPQPPEITAVSDGFITKICNMEIPTISYNNKPEYCKGNTFDVTLKQQTSVVYSDIEWLLLRYGSATVIGKSHSCTLPSTLDSGQYKLICNVKNSKQCPASTDTLIINIFEAPTLLVRDYRICKGDVITIDSLGIKGQQPFSFLWDNTSTLDDRTKQYPIASPTVTTQYTVLVSDKNGCTTTAKVTVQVLDLPKVVISSSGSLEFCKGDNVTLDAGTGYDRYLWSNGATTQTITVDTSGTFSVSVFYSSGCTATSPLVSVVVHDLPFPTIIRVGDALQTESASTYQWFLDGTMLSGATNQQIQLTKAGIYSVKVSNQFGCVGISAPYNATILGKSEITIGSATGFVGTSVSIPLSLLSSDKLDILQADSFAIKVSYNASLLSLTSLTNQVLFTPPIINKGRATVLLTGKRSSTSGVLSALSFNVTLGDSEETVLSIDDVQWNANNVSVKRSNGLFTLAGLCKKNGTRLFKDNGEIQLHQIKPNPSGDKSELVFSIIEQGRTTIQMFDINGKLIETLLDKEQTDGEYTLLINTLEYPEGTFFIRMQTPSQVRSTSFVIQR